MSASKLPTSFLAALLALSAVAGAAEANTIAIAAPEEPPVPKRFEINVGMLTGGLEMGTSRADAHGLAISSGIRMGDLSLLAEVDHLGLNLNERGKLTRLGMVARYSIVRFGDDDDVANTDVWLEGGAGWERVTWRSGGVLDRPDVTFGAGWQGSFVLDGDTAHPRFLGPFFAFRGLVSEGPDSTDMAACGGPCDRATRPSGFDVSFMFNMGLNWGRKSF